jgi:hypothetical protein
LKLAARPLRTNAELEHAIAEDPYDEQRWIVLEDWLLEQNDPRGILVQLEKAGRIAGAGRVYRRLYPQLLGPEHAWIAPRLFTSNWRAGYLRECYFTGETVDALCRAPASRLLRALTLLLGPERVAPALRTLATAACAQTLHGLTLSNNHVHIPTLDAGLLAPLSRLRSLALRGAYIDPPADVPRIVHLVIAPTRYDIHHLDPMVTASRFPHVTELIVDLAFFAEPELPRPSLVAMLDGRFVPSLARFEIRNGTRELAHEAIDILSASALLSQLRVVNLGPVDGHMALRAHHGTRFERILVTLPADY